MRLLFLIALIAGGVFLYKYLRDADNVTESKPVEYVQTLQDNVKKADKAAQKAAEKIQEAVKEAKKTIED